MCCLSDGERSQNRKRWSREKDAQSEALDELVGAVLSRFAERLGTRVVHLDIPRKLPLVLVDPKLVELVLMNLVENALRYTPAETALHISARSTGDTDDEVVVSVADEGAGILELER